MMRVTVDQERCQGHTLCNLIAPEIFKLRDHDGHAYVEMDEVPPHLADLAMRALEGCPERAITVEP